MPTVSRYPTLHIPDVNVWEFLLSRSDRPYPDDKDTAALVPTLIYSTTVVFSDVDIPRAYTYRALRDATIQFGPALLAEPGWKKGDVVAIFSPNDVDFPVVLWGAIWACGVALQDPLPRSYPVRDAACRHPVGSIGPLLANQVSKFVSPDGVEVPDGEVGELWVKGPNVFKGYLNNPAKTREALSPDGYFKTGDIGYQDREGNVFITDRSKELINYNAFQVAPAELEGILMAHPKVAVVGVQDESRATEVPRAYVVVVAGVERNRETALEVEEWIKTKVANHK
ncbi:hypothetical protein PV04_04140 [Phialophora macrospora]|uniref:Uncharacterized protein n=1 Tax=Phialophora macrospora TaxID=1851006 RepID=A0A0D2G8E2_9EURO|nr:hypothetical protein PV04_04140 [Phialophora macrospora]